jgi:hypothetical protein
MPEIKTNGPETESRENGTAGKAEKDAAARSLFGRLKSLLFKPGFSNAKEKPDEADEAEKKLSRFQRLQLTFYMLKPWAKIALPSFMLVVVIAVGVAFFSIFHSDIKLEASIIDLYNNDTIIENYQRLPEKYLDYIIENFGIKPEQAHEVLNGEGNWKFYCLKVGFKNNHRYPIDINHFRIHDNGKENVWLNSSFDAAIGIPADYQEVEQVNVDVLVNGKGMNIEQVLRAVESLTVEVEYARTIGYDKKGRMLSDEDEHIFDETPLMYAQLKGSE